MAAALIIGGYMVKNKDSFDAKYICLSCLRLFRDPNQLKCGHRKCQTCLSPQDGFVQCLACEEKTALSEVLIDRGFRRDMEKLEVQCIFCDWFEHLKSYQDHLEKRHQQYQCSHCAELFTSLLSLEEHKEKLCTNILVDCPLKQYGCEKQIFRRELGSHSLTEEHQSAIIICLLQLVSKFEDRHEEPVPIDFPMEIETTHLSSEVFPTSSVTAAMTTTATTTQNVTDGITNMEQIIKLLSDSVHALDGDLIQLSDNIVRQSESIETLEPIIPAIKASIEESNSVLDAINFNLTILQQDLFTLYQKYEDRQTTSYDGTIIWKITNFQEKMIDAQSERHPSIYSPPFFSSPTGYKMCARLYLYGDGNARRTHMSLFFVLMRGPYDHILVFPFSYKVTFCLYDQSSEKSHIIDSFRPDIRSNSFQRPRSNMNIASGIPKFVSLSVFETRDNPYVKDDTMFIKVIVDFENMPRTILPYALSLNPALPTRAQQKMIRQEIERKAQQIESTTPVPVVSSGGKKWSKE